MYGRGSTSAALSPGTILVLLLCACGLAMHFIAEGLTLAVGAPGVELVARAGTVHGAHEHGEDHFIFSSSPRTLVEHMTFPLATPAAPGSFSFSIPPQLPPPNR